MTLQKIYLYIISLLILFCYSCKKEILNDEKFIRNLSNDTSLDLPLLNEGIMIFIRKDEDVYVTSLRDLNSINKSHYKSFSNFDTFLVEVLNNDLLSKKYLNEYSEQTFQADKKILAEFQNKDLAFILKKYCLSTNLKKRFYLKSNLTSNIELSVLYILFKNNFYIMKDDFLGKYLVIDKET